MNQHRYTPKWIDTLQENEIFVFGCRNSGRHFDGASAFALKNFGAIMGQREGRQGQSYAIPTIGGHIGRYELKQSIATFTQYAAAHPELHFLVTPVGCGGGLWSVKTVAPMFRQASKLNNVSLPEEFWDELDRGRMVELRRLFVERLESIRNKVNTVIGKLRFWHMTKISPQKLYNKLVARQLAGRSCYTTYLGENMEWIYFYDDKIYDAVVARSIINHIDKTAYMLIDNTNHLYFIKDEDIDWESISNLPQEVKERVIQRERKYDFGVLCYENGLAKIKWQISPDGSYHYLDKYYGGKQTDEKYIALWGVIDTHCHFVEKLHIASGDGVTFIQAGVSDDRTSEKLEAWENY